MQGFRPPRERRAVEASAAEAGAEAGGDGRRVGVGGAREARAAELVRARRAQHARATGGGAEDGVAHAGTVCRRRW